MKIIQRYIASFMVAVLLFAGGSVLIPATASAATSGACGQSAGGFLSFPTWYKYLDPSFTDPDGPGGPEPGECNINFEFPGDIAKVLLAGFEIILRVASLLAIGYIIYGGIQYIISQGEPERIKNARTTIVNALIGMVITIMSSAIVNLIGNSIS